MSETWSPTRIAARLCKLCDHVLEWLDRLCLLATRLNDLTASRVKEKMEPRLCLRLRSAIVSFQIGLPDDDRMPEFQNMNEWDALRGDMSRADLLKQGIWRDLGRARKAEGGKP